MPCLIPEILFDIGEKLIGDGGDPDGVYRFALSGKEPLKAMKNVFSSITNLKLKRDAYTIGWGLKSQTFKLHDQKGHLNCLMACIGDFVKYLYIIDFNPIFQPIINRIAKNKRLIMLDIFSCDPIILNQLFSTISLSTIKDLKIPNFLMTENFRYSFSLDSLTITNQNNTFSISNCFKTTKLICSSYYSTNMVSFSIDNFYHLSPYLSTIKELVINECHSLHDRTAVNRLENITKHFASLELLKIIIDASGIYSAANPMFNSIQHFIDNISNAKKVPSNMILLFERYRHAFPNINRRFCYESFDNFYYDETITEFYCFRKTIQSAGAESTILQIQIS